MPLVQEKRCSRCGQVKLRSEFTPRRGTRDGLAYTCKVCKSEYQRDRYLNKNKDKVLVQRRRRPLTDAADAAGWKIRRDVERVQRIFADPRFAYNKEQVAVHLHGHLEYAVEVCQDLLNRLDKTGE